ncbi:DUF2062 domain-containing protein [Mangrovibacterium lignilyticum]|uniref:DUF2062 domain-containing protein n=1 Tax=Mangrovibacterium lignilyticum TaxID=2668052 RepID=UPI0013D07A53
MPFSSKKVCKPARLIRVLNYKLIQSSNPHQAALSLTIGFYLGIFPIFGFTTVLCLLAGYIFRLNQPITLLVNILIAPLQLLLAFPFFVGGNFLFSELSSIQLTMNFDELLQFLKTDCMGYLIQYGIRSMSNWSVSGLLTGVPFYKLILFLTRRFSGRKKTSIFRHWFHTHFWQND